MGTGRNLVTYRMIHSFLFVFYRNILFLFMVGTKKSAKSRTKNRTNNLKKKKKFKYKQKLDKFSDGEPSNPDSIDDITFQVTVEKKQVKNQIFYLKTSILHMEG